MRAGNYLIRGYLILNESEGPRVLLVGAGQLGSRYLEGLKSVSKPLDVTVIDPSVDALALAEHRWDQVGPARQHPRPVFWSSIGEAIERGPAAYDLGIVSTGARHRLGAVEAIVAGTTIRHWVLEKVLAQSSCDVRAIEELVGSGSAAFVNTCRRMMPGYVAMKDMVVPPLSVKILGGEWGLASNAIHFIDMVAWMTGSSLSDVTAESDGVPWHQTKRVGYYDMTGQVNATFVDGSDLAMVASQHEGQLTISIIDGAGSRWDLDQASGVARSGRGQTMRVDFELQSAMTPRLVSKLVATGSCDLTTLEESARIHGPLLDALLHDWNAATGRSDSHVPIT